MSHSGDVWVVYVYGGDEVSSRASNPRLEEEGAALGSAHNSARRHTRGLSRGRPIRLCNNQHGGTASAPPRTCDSARLWRRRHQTVEDTAEDHNKQRHNRSGTCD